MTKVENRTQNDYFKIKRVLNIVHTHTLVEYVFVNMRTQFKLIAQKET